MEVIADQLLPRIHSQAELWDQLEGQFDRDHHRQPAEVAARHVARILTAQPVHCVASMAAALSATGQQVILGFPTAVHYIPGQCGRQQQQWCQVASASSR